MNNDQKLDLILEKISSMDERMNSMEKKIDSMEKRMDSMEKRMDSMEKRMDSMEKRMDSMSSKIDIIEADVAGIQLQIENEIVPGIMRVAEGHLDLDRNLKDTRTSRAEYEILTIKVNHLESVVKSIEQKIN